MNDEKIVAVYDTPAHAELAIQDIIASGVPESAISKHSGSLDATTTTTDDVEPVREKGFWASLFGGEPNYDIAVYDRSMENGSTVVTVQAPEADIKRILEILDSHDPIDIDERAASYGLMQATSEREPLVDQSTVRGVATSAATTGDETLRLAEESVVIGKRLINRGSTRIRRYVVETPVEESVSLHHETVTLDRRPVTDGGPIGNADFSEKTIEMTETSEEAVVSKNARVVEEVSLRKQATDRVETIRDTVRKEEVEVEQIPSETTKTGAGTTPVDPRAPKI
jgi:uncharacterized protein (TIGR02271 family)